MLKRIVKKLFRSENRKGYKQFNAFNGKIINSRFELKKEDINFFNEGTSQTDFDRHYVYHTAWAARMLARTNPSMHVDISSSLYFSAIASSFVPIEFYDYRPADIHLPNLKSAFGDLLKLPFPSESVKSLSCMHVVEHIGLGRYGDPLDYDGDLKAIRELVRVLAPEGNLFFVTPIGHKAKIVFNAHRIYTKEQIINYFEELELVEFSLISEHWQDKGLVVNPDKALIDRQDYGCGCFWFKKGIK